MSKRAAAATDDPLFDLYDRLDRFEELLEDMADLGVTSVADAEARIIEINEQIDRLEAGAQE